MCGAAPIHQPSVNTRSQVNPVTVHARTRTTSSTAIQVEALDLCTQTPSHHTAIKAGMQTPLKPIAADASKQTGPATPSKANTIDARTQTWAKPLAAHRSAPTSLAAVDASEQITSKTIDASTELAIFPRGKFPYASGHAWTRDPRCRSQG